ncbi:MAG: tetratricopeptide repeat protein, partial [Deltaproteobacteria bacterium]
MTVRATAISLCLLAFCRVAAAGPFERKLDLVERGNSEYARNNFEKALEAYEKAEELVSNRPLLHFNRGAALYKLGRHREAREAFQRALGVKDPQMKKRI